MTRPSAHERLSAALERIDNPQGEGAKAVLTVYREASQAAAEASDARARTGTLLGPLDGAIVTVKDLFDVAGDVTRAGSKVLADEGHVAERDAVVVQRLRAAGAVIVGKTNMSEFAFTGVGANPHYGTPGNPADRARVPGGSSAGAGVAVGDGMCEIGVGSDTGGSVRIPASLCGIVGFKPSRQRVSTVGAFPLSYSLDSIGPLAKSVAQCAEADAVLAGDDPWTLDAAPLAGLRFGVAQGLPLENLDDTVGRRFPEALDRLEKAGVHLTYEKLPQFDDMIALQSRTSILVAEAFSVHSERMKARSADVDPIVAGRLSKGADIAAHDYVNAVRTRHGLIAAMDERLRDIDVLVLPATAIVAPRFDDIAEPKAFMQRNAMLLRNTTIGNFFDLCGVSLPLPRDGHLPVGLMLLARNGHDRQLLRIAAAVERLFS
ncbi:amidase [Undibacter mobilis]|uniref:Amidase n=1 Tax=Undibacter mobilis TaxID=2292256 RepID=A0A371BBZ6_9BRAD|nr:amidase [Undibacter mobilis]RDV05092.1 amidase [Undibacter mobilis]